jgi:hypothetical protein
MSVASTALANESLKNTALIVVGVLAVCALFGWQMWRLGKRFDRQEKDPSFLRKSLRRGGYLYVVAALLGISLVLLGDEPKESLFGLPIALLLIWFFFHSAAKVKVPPK